MKSSLQTCLLIQTSLNVLTVGSNVLLEKLTVTQPVKVLDTNNGTRMFTAVFTRPNNLTLSGAQ